VRGSHRIVVAKWIIVEVPLADPGGFHLCRAIRHAAKECGQGQALRCTRPVYYFASSEEFVGKPLLVFQGAE
jgi:hypothetical protein